MKSLICTLAMILVVAGGLVPLAAAQDRTIGQTVDDATITTAVKAKLVADHPQNLVKVNVDTTRGVVRLSGIVNAEEHRIEAERLARRTGGVRDVVNDLKVEAPAAAPASR